MTGTVSPDLLDIVGDLHEGVADPASWTRGLDRLSDSLGESRILLGSLRRGHPGVELLAHRITTPGVVDRLSGPLGNPLANPWIAAAWQGPLRRIITTADVGEERLRASPAWTEVHAATGMEFALGTALDRLPERAEVCLIARGKAPFDADDQKFFAALIPHVARAWRVRRAVDQWRAIAEDMGAVLDRLERGVVITGDDGRLRYANRAAERLLRKGEGIDATGGRLRAARPADTERLQAIIARATRTGIGRDAQAVDAVALPRDASAVPLAVVAEPLAPAHGDRLGQSGHGAVVFVSDADASCTPPPERLQFVYNLSAAEAAFTCRVQRGDGVGAASAALGISENTGKTHLKSVFEKIGVTRQAELVRRVIADVGGLCDGGGHGPDGAAEAVAAEPPRG